MNLQILNIVGNKKYIYICLATVLFFVVGCNTKSLSPKSFSDYYQDNKNDLLKIRTSDELKFEAEYIPTDVLAIRDMDNAKENFNKEEFKKNFRNYDSAYYFKFKIQTSDNSSMKKIIRSKENLSRLNQYLMTDIQKDFVIEIGSKKICCGILNVEKDIQLQNCFSFIMSFEKEQFKDVLQDDITFIYNDNIFQNGILKFHFNKDNINNFPKIKAI